MTKVDLISTCSCHEAGAVCLVHATQHNLLISAGKKGQVTGCYTYAGMPNQICLMLAKYLGSRTIYSSKIESLGLVFLFLYTLT